MPNNGLIISGNVGIGTLTPIATLDVTRSTPESSGVNPYLQIDPVADTNITLSTESPIVFFNFDNANRTWTQGALTTQSYFKIDQPTIAFSGASTVTDAATIGVTGGVIQGTNATVTNSHALRISAGNVSTATNSYGITVNAQTGATNNYAGVLLGGNVGVGTSTPTATTHLSRSTAATSVVTPYLQVDTVADTGLTAESSVVLFNFNSATRTWATGAYSTQRFFRIDQPTIAFAGASTITTAATMAIVGGVSEGSNATLTNSYGLLIEGIAKLTRKRDFSGLM